MSVAGTGNTEIYDGTFRDRIAVNRRNSLFLIVCFLAFVTVFGYVIGYAWIGDPEGGKGNLRSDIYRELWKLFKANGIEIPFPQREVRMLGPEVRNPEKHAVS